MGGLSADTLTKDAAIETNKQSAILIINYRNKDDESKYHAAMRDYNLNVESGQMSPVAGGLNYKAPPPVPFKWVLSQPDADGFIQYERSTTETVCPADAVEGDHSLTQKQLADQAVPGTVVIGHEDLPSNPGYFSIGAGDGFPYGQTTLTQPDGFKYLKIRFGAFGGYYLKLTGG